MRGQIGCMNIKLSIGGVQHEVGGFDEGVQVHLSQRPSSTGVVLGCASIGTESTAEGRVYQAPGNAAVTRGHRGQFRAKKARKDDVGIKKRTTCLNSAGATREHHSCSGNLRASTRLRSEEARHERRVLDQLGEIGGEITSAPSSAIWRARGRSQAKRTVCPRRARPNATAAAGCTSPPFPPLATSSALNCPPLRLTAESVPAKHAHGKNTLHRSRGRSYASSQLLL